MVEEVVRILDQICDRVEKSHPGIICAHHGFSRARMPTEDNDIVVEAFFAPLESNDSIIRSTHEERRRLRRQYGVSVAIVTHYADDTLQYYKEDVNAILSSRGLSVLLDHAAFQSKTTSVHFRWSGTTSWNLRTSSRGAPQALGHALAGRVAPCLEPAKNWPTCVGACDA